MAFGSICSCSSGSQVASKLEVAAVDQGGALTPHQKAVVGGAVAQAELNVEAAAVPVE